MLRPSSIGASRVWLACALGWVTSGCGVVGDARERLEAFLRDEPAPAASPEPVDPAPVEEAEPVVVARAGEAAAGDTASGDTGSGGDAGSGGATKGDSGDPDPVDATGGSTGLLPMSYARPPTTPEVATTGGGTGAVPPGPVVPPPTTPTAEPEPTKEPPPPPTSPTTTAPTCIEGEWEAEDLHTWFRREITRQAHGRTVRSRGESGRYRLRFEAGVLHGEAEHRRMSFDARLANVDIRYTVDVHGEFAASARVEGSDALVVDRPTRNTLRARELVRFSAEKSESRTLELPVEGRWQLTCAPGALELRLLEDATPGPALRFVRPRP